MRRAKESPAPLPRDMKLLLGMAKAADDPREKERCLLFAESLNEADLSVQRELLMLGNLARRDPKKLDFSVIKCYVFHALEHPEQHDEASQQRMTREIFDHPRLLRCLSLAQDPDAFLRDYLMELSGDYLRLFIEGAREHAGGIMGFATAGMRLRGMSRPCADIVRNIFLSPFLSKEEQSLLAGAFYRSCAQFFSGRTQEMDSDLGAELCAKIL